MVENLMKWWYGYLPENITKSDFIFDFIIHLLIGGITVFVFVNSVIIFFK